MPTINWRSLQSHYQNDREGCVSHLVENLENGTLKPNDFSLRDMFRALHPEGRGTELLTEVSYGKGRGKMNALREAASYVNSADFSNITGQLVINKVKEAFAKPDMLHPQLCTIVSSDFVNGERIPGVGGISPSLIEAVGEGKPYPLLGLNETWLDTVPTVKHGGIIGFTREMFIQDRTGQMLQEGGMLGDACDVLVEKEVIDVATGATTRANNYNRNGVSMNTYLTSGAYINDTTVNALDAQANEWRAVEKAMLLFDVMTNPNTGEPIGVPQTVQMLVPSALRMTADRIQHATSVQTVDMRAQATTIRTEGPNPLGSRVQVLSNQYVKSRTGSSTKWFLGDYKRAIYWMQTWALETLSAASNDEAMFTADIWSRHKADFRGVGQMVEPRYCTRSDT